MKGSESLLEPLRKYGGGGDILVEQGLTVCENFKTRCFTPRVDIVKIQNLSSHGMSRNAIAKELGLARATVSRALQSDRPQY
ncbi:MAG: hypothetical protein CME62_09560 [Halobacteriovoraceae bacterium]|nr:hypothetical protein [Halobacteriovoraceae bacterium]|tara:strand:- start:6675 stop:6920 length:246 start_codon:yes stop_codon:yes gene_type:complete